MAEGNQKFDIDIVDEDMREIGFFWIFAKYILPYAVALILIIAAIFAFNSFIGTTEIEINEQSLSIGAVIIILILILALR